MLHTSFELLLIKGEGDVNGLSMAMHTMTLQTQRGHTKVTKRSEREKSHYIKAKLGSSHNSSRLPDGHAEYLRELSAASDRPHTIQ